MEEKEVLIPVGESSEQTEEFPVITEETETACLSNPEALKQTGDESESEGVTVAEETSSQEAETLVEKAAENPVVNADEASASETEVIVRESIVDSIHDLKQKIDEMDKLFREKIAHTETEDMVIRNMHNELTTYRNGMYEELVTPILRSICNVRDSIMKTKARYEKKVPEEQSISLREFGYYADDLEDILGNNDVICFHAEPGDDFVPGRQRVVNKISTTDETLNRKIKESVSDGYSFKGRTLVIEKVNVYSYEKIDEAEEEGKNNG